jgi:hypothetical protein
VTHSSSPIDLVLSARRVPDGVLFTVSDNGPGIPPEYHEVIFRKFGQVSGPTRAACAQLGTRPTFCKLVVDLHKGMIWVNSKEGEGSSFYVQLPERQAGSGLCDNDGMRFLIRTARCRANQLRKAKAYPDDFAESGAVGWTPLQDAEVRSITAAP